MRFQVTNQIVTGSRLTGYIVNASNGPSSNQKVDGLRLTGSTHVIHDMEPRTLAIELRRRAIKKLVPCGDIDRMLKIPHSHKVACGFQTAPEECLYDSDLNRLLYRAS